MNHINDPINIENSKNFIFKSTINTNGGDFRNGDDYHFYSSVIPLHFIQNVAQKPDLYINRFIGFNQNASFGNAGDWFEK